jgi:hypothetical protein
VEADGNLVQDLADFAREKWAQLRGLADVRRLFRQSGTESVQAIYTNFLTLMAAGGFARDGHQTPYEYEPVAEKALPPCEPDIAVITEAFVRARYGEVDVGAQELESLQKAWESIRGEGEVWLDGRPE